MYIVLRKCLEKVYVHISKVHWAWLPISILALFLSTWASMAYFEGDVPIAQKNSYWWYFVVTSTTVGYGDLFPVTLGGRITGACIMMCGIGLIAALITKITDATIQHTRNKMKGLLQITYSGHILILGYVEGKTAQLVKEILADTPDVTEKIVLCTDQVSENPLPGKVDFVFGDPSHSEILAMANVSGAKRIVAYGSNDNSTLAYGLAVNGDCAADVHIVAYFDRAETAGLLRRNNRRIECITSLSVPLIAHSMQDPGTMALMQDLVSHDTRGASFRLYIPASCAGRTSFFRIMYRFKQLHDVLIMGICDTHEHDSAPVLNPGADSIVMGGMSLFYFGDNRLEDGDIAWDEVMKPG